MQYFPAFSACASPVTVLNIGVTYGEVVVTLPPPHLWSWGTVPQLFRSTAEKNSIYAFSQHTEHTLFPNVTHFQFVWSLGQAWYQVNNVTTYHLVYSFTYTIATLCWKIRPGVINKTSQDVKATNYKFLFSCLQFWRSCAILSATTPRAFQPIVGILSI